MANVTDPLARAVHGTNPQNLIEYITRQKIYDSRYWKEECFGLNATDIVVKATKLSNVSGSYGGNMKPSNFLCLALKMLQIQPDDDIIEELVQNEDFKYVRALGAFYLRLTGRPQTIYELLEPLYRDYQRLRIRTVNDWNIMCMDEFIDSLLRDDFVCGIAMPRLPKRSPLEEAGYLEMRTSVLGDADTAEEKLSELAKRGVDAAQEALMKRKMASVVETERSVRGDRDRSSSKKALDDDELVAKKEDATPHEKRRSSRKNSRSRSRSRSWGRRDSDDEKRGRYQDRDIDHERKVQQRNNDDYRGYYDKQESRYRDNKREDYHQNDHKSYNNVDSESYYYGNDSRSSRKRDDDVHQCNYNESSSRHTRRKEDRENCREVDRGRYDRSSRSEEDRYNDDKSNRRKEKRRKRDKDSYGSLFKKDHSSHSKKRSDKYDDEKNNGAEMEGSEEYWNDQRAKLGLKPLK